MRRRDFIAGIGGIAATWPCVAQAQPALPVVGFFRSTPAEGFVHFFEAFRQGLKDEGFSEGQNVAIEQRAANNQLDQLPSIASELVGRRVAVIIANSLAAEAARAATTTIPIVFVTGDDPVRAGFVSSLNRPGGNLTGVTFFGGGLLGPKRMELLRDILPNTTVVAVLWDPSFPASVAELPGIEAAGRALGRRVVAFKATREADLEPAFAQMVAAGAGAVLVAGGSFLASQRKTIAESALRHRLPSTFDIRDAVVDGGLMSYSASAPGAYRQAGTYVGKILKGATTTDLPVLQPTTFELVVNLKTAKALGIDIPPSIMLRADEVIE